jgi:hypothetical protein
MAIQKITSGIIADGAIVATDIADGIVTNAKLAGSITSDKITSVSNTAIAGLIQSAQIGSVSNTSIAGLIQSAQIGSANASVINAGTLAGARLPTGSVLQVVEGSTASETFTTSTSYQATNLSGSITPSSASNKVLIIVSSTIYIAGSTYAVNGTIFRGATDIASANSAGVLFWGEGAGGWCKCATTFLDSPSSTSSLTYALHIKSNNAGTNAGANRNNTRNSIILMEIAA